MALYLVTGGAGFIGSHIVERLVTLGEQVRVIDNCTTGRVDNIREWLDRVDLHQVDIRDVEAIRPLFEGVDYVLHQAALPSVPRSIRDPLATNASNSNGALNVLVAARDAGVKRVVFASSSSVYGSNPGLPKHEAMRPMPISPYAASKLAGESYCHAFANVYGLETIALRYFNVFGPRQDPKSQYAAVIPLFITKILGGEQPVVYGDGLQSRDFTYVDNVVHANLCATRATDGVGQVFNIACGERHTIRDMVASLNEILGTSIEPRYDSARVGDVQHSEADISAARACLRYEPQVTWTEGLARTAAWYARPLSSSSRAR